MPTQVSGNTGVSKVQEDVAGTIPIGGLIDFAGSVAPANYLALPTTATNISRTTYAALFAAIGTTWGAGDGSTTFGMPWFPADYAAVQANANVGSSTTGEVKSHTHTHWEPAIASVGSTPNNVYGSRSSANTGATGGTANLAAGVRILKCVRYQ